MLIQLKGACISPGGESWKVKELSTVRSSTINKTDPAHNLKYFGSIGLGVYLSASFKRNKTNIH